MNTNSTRTILLISALLASFSNVTGAVTTLENKNDESAVISWPTTERPALKLSESQVDFDGHKVKVLKMQVSDIEIQLAGSMKFQIEKSSSSRYSGVMLSESLPYMSIGLSVFKKGEFLPSLNADSWNAYVNGITASNSDTNVVFENSNIEERITPYVFNKKFRQVAYEQKIGSSIVKKREIFAFIGNNLLVLTASGSKEAIDSNWFRFENLVSDMRLIQ